MRQVYINGGYLPETEAKISVFDRGFLFGDAVYEVTYVIDRKLVDYQGHMTRLRRSLGEIDMSLTMTDDDLLAVHRELVELNDIDEGLVYLEITRGAADRDFIFPDASVPNTVVLFTQKKALMNAPAATRGLKVLTVEDQRWARCDIKTVQLLYPSLAKTRGKAQGADDIWFQRDGYVTEGSSNNAYIVSSDGKIITHEKNNDILHGITRNAVMDTVADLGLDFEERPFLVTEAMEAAEAFSTSSSGLVTPVVSIDGKQIGDAKPGPVSKQLRQKYIEGIRSRAI